MSKPFCPLRYTWGVQKEADLLKTIENNLGEEIIREENLVSTKDYQSKNYNIELKSRRYYDCNKYSNWLVPVSKFRDTSKPIIIYYYWDGDKTLWRYDYKVEDVPQFIIGPGPISSQIQYDIPKRFFTQIKP